MNNLLSIFLKSGKISTDTRKIERGSIFFALKGPNFNGNKFAEKAISLGAIVAVIDEPEYQNENTILVDDTLKGLQQLAHDYRNTISVKVIGLTGSNGKTTTKELLSKALGTKFNVFSTPGNFNNHIGVPLTLLSIPLNTDFAIIEMGDNKPGDIKELCEIACPDLGFITNIGKDHIEGYGSMEGNIATKKELVDYLDQNNRLFIYSSDSENVPNLAFGIKKSLEINNYLSSYNFKQLPSNPFVTYEIGENFYETNLVGDYNFENIKFSIAISLYLEVELPTSNKAICSYSPVNNRSQFIKTSNNEVILDAYNANPSSVENALKSFLKIKSDLPKVAILGDMLELGNISKEEHLNVLNKLDNQNDVKPFFVGSIYFQFKDKFDYTFFENTEDANNYFKINTIKKALVLFKGSRGIALEKLLENF